MAVDHVVIVGTGAAGYAVAEGLHTGGFTGAVTMIGEETEEPYDRPPLSKEVLSGAWDIERAALIAAKRAAPLNPTILTGVRATALHVADHRFELSDGQAISYDAAVIASGVYPRRLPHPDAPNVRVLRTLQDSLALHGLITRPGTRLVVVGGGFLGLEAAATARGLGATVTVVEPIPGPPLASRIGLVAAEKLLALHQSNDVTIHTGIGVDAIALGDGTTIDVTLGDGAILNADVVLVAVGSVPATDWLEGSALTVENGVVCDEFCRAAEDVWAAGDVASWLHVGYDRRLRLEHRTNAQEQGQYVARRILGEDAPFTPIPYFWTDHYKQRIQLSGVIPLDADVAFVEGGPSDEKWVQAFSRDGVVGAVLAWNAPRLMAQHRAQLVATPL